MFDQFDKLWQTNVKKCKSILAKRGCTMYSVQCTRNYKWPSIDRKACKFYKSQQCRQKFYLIKFNLCIHVFVVKNGFFSSFCALSFKVTLYISCFRNNRENIRIEHFSTQKNDVIFQIINHIRESGMPLLKWRLKIITLSTLMLVF